MWNGSLQDFLCPGGSDDDIPEGKETSPGEEQIMRQIGEDK